HVTVFLQGGSDFEAAPDHHVQISLRDAALDEIPVAEASWDGMTPRTVEGDVSAALLHDGAYTLAVRNVGDTNAAYSMVFMNRFTIAYPRRPVASAGVFEGRVPRSPTLHASPL